MYENSKEQIYGQICATNYERSLDQAEKLTCNSQAVFQQTCNRTHNWSTLYQGKLTSTPSTSHTWGSSTKRKAAAMDYTILVLGPTYGGYFHSYTH